MDLESLIRNLRRERQKLDEIIQAVQDLKLQQIAQAAMPKPVKKRRGRKSMGDLERAEVSKRMKAYWAKRRQSRN